MSEYKVGDRVEEVENGVVVDRGTVLRILDREVWCLWERSQEELFFHANNNSFRLAIDVVITPSIVRTVLKAYQEYSKMEYMPEYVHKEVYDLISKKGVKESQEFKDFMVQYEKFKSYL
jgi:hypothetical protein